MKFHLTVQQLKFYSDNGYIGFDNLGVEFPQKEEARRDLWRKEPSLEQLIVRKLGPLALQLTRKTKLYLACDERISETWDTKSAIQKHFSFQGLACVVALLSDPQTPLFFMHPSTWPSMLPGWPTTPTDCYLIAYGTNETRYVNNPKDPLNHWLKKYGFGFGDSLQKNPMIGPI